MTGTAVPTRERPTRLPLPMTLRIGWRSLWRNGRRTALTAGGVAFAVFLVVSSGCIQLGSYQTMEETATSLLVGQMQIQNAAYADDQRLEATLAHATALEQVVSGVPGVVAVAPRLEAFVLASAGERSFGAELLGVDPDAERRVVTLDRRIVDGRYLSTPGEGVLGDGLARNLGVGVGDEVVMLGSGSQGGVAALVVTVAGVLHTGIVEVDRSLLLTDIATMAGAFGLDDEAHKLVVRTADLGHVERIADRVRGVLPGHWPDGPDGASVEVRTWPQVLPDLRQVIDVDRMSGRLFYWMVMVLVAFSAVNTFIMTVFERTREFGMMLAIGMRPGRIMAMLQWEAFALWLIGASVGLALACALVAWLSDYGIYLGADMERLAEELYLPDRLYPTFAPEALVTAPLVMLVGTQIAALLPGLKIRRLTPVDALRVAA